MVTYRPSNITCKPILEELSTLSGGTSSTSSITKRLSRIYFVTNFTQTVLKLSTFRFFSVTIVLCTSLSVPFSSYHLLHTFFSISPSPHHSTHTSLSPLLYFLSPFFFPCLVLSLFFFFFSPFSPLPSPSPPLSLHSIFLSVFYFSNFQVFFLLSRHFSLFNFYIYISIYLIPEVILL